MTRTEVIQMMETMKVSGEMVYTGLKTVSFKVGSKEATYLRTTIGSDLPLWLKWGDSTYVVNLSTYEAPLKRRLYYMYTRPDRLYKLQRLNKKDVAHIHYGQRDYERYIKSDYMN